MYQAADTKNYGHFSSKTCHFSSKTCHFSPHNAHFPAEVERCAMYQAADTKNYGHFRAETGRCAMYQPADTNYQPADNIGLDRMFVKDVKPSLTCGLLHLLTCGFCTRITLSRRNKCS